ncbi:serine/threonine-protein kinase pakG [Ctenocephalides felis]|uniref:serine/threonine-protein kinase pakG n=1 Tax=Ctenocephalides felis TaxID=7515 RepID=UPI000E6E4CBF|nr:serine/threonine-protein kinase pakG [Ctenocephalides felis]
MREIDTEAPVVWPAWCYSGDGAESESAAGALPPSLPAAPVRARGKRRTNLNHSSNHSTSIHHQLQHQQNQHQLSIASGVSQAALVTPASMNGAAGADHHMNNNNNSLNNNNSGVNNNNNSSSLNNNHAVKSERLSPGRAALTPDNQSSASRSRSVTPSSSSYPGTPPQNPHDRGPSPAQTQATIRHMEQVMGRNCSDFIRSLAAKYNNSNPNDYFGAARNGFPALDPRFAGPPFKGSPFPGLLAPLLPGAASSAAVSVSPSTSATSQRGSPTQQTLAATAVAATAAAAAAQRERPLAADSPPKRTGETGPSMYPGFPFPPGSMFQPLIDMSSTQALVQMMRAAKEDQMQTLLKNPSSLSPSAATTILHSPPTSSLNIPNTNSNASSLGGLPTSAVAPLTKRSSTDSHPLDLSSANLAKRPKMTDRIAGSTKSSAEVSPSMPAAQNRCPGPPHCEGDVELASWGVEDVCNFVAGIDICAEYSQNFRDQCIDGSGLPLLTEEHLTGSLGMKLGPALKLRSILAKRTGSSCPNCGGRRTSQSAPQSPSGGNRENEFKHRPLSRGSNAGNS